jgi:fimbrial chaperone protein
MAVTTSTTHLKQWLSAIILTLLISASIASEASIQVSPTQVFVAAGRNAAGLTLLNTSNVSLYAQIRVFEWSQQDGEDKLLATHGIVASPPMLKLTPGVSQLVRIVRNNALLSPIESSYRIIIDEMPMKADTNDQTIIGTDNTQSDGLNFRLRYSLPVFLAPSKQTAIQPVLDTRLIEDKGAHFLQINNAGNGHAQVADLTWIQDKQRINIASGLAGYVLPGQQRQWRLPANLNLIKGGEFTARINGELLERVLVPITAKN